MASVRHLKVIQDRSADRSPISRAAGAPGEGNWRWVALGTALCLTLWIVLGLIFVGLGPWAVVGAFGVASTLGGALVACLAAERPIRAAAMSGLMAALLSLAISVARGALSGYLAVLPLFVLLTAVGVLGGALGGKIVMRSRAPSGV
jgi:hypothetical protein